MALRGEVRWVPSAHLEGWGVRKDAVAERQGSDRRVSQYRGCECAAKSGDRYRGWGDRCRGCEGTAVLPGASEPKLASQTHHRVLRIRSAPPRWKRFDESSA